MSKFKPVNPPSAEEYNRALASEAAEMLIVDCMCGRPKLVHYQCAHCNSEGNSRKSVAFKDGNEPQKPTLERCDLFHTYKTPKELYAYFETHTGTEKAMLYMGAMLFNNMVASQL